MKKLIQYFIQREVLVNLLILLIIIFGTMSALTLTSSFFPEQPTKFIVVEAAFPGASPEEMEEGITLKVEENLQGISGIDRITSTSQENASNIRVELLPRADANVVLQEVKNAVDRISSFPPGLERIVVFKEEILNFTAKIALSGNVPLYDLKKKARLLEDELRDFEEISKIEISGYTLPEIEIGVKENQLRRYNIGFREIADAIRNENINVTGGKIRGKETEKIIRANGKGYTAEELAEIVIKAMPDGKKIRLADIAQVKDTWSEDTDRVYFDGKPAVILTVNTTNEEDILQAAASIRQYIAQFNERNQVVSADVVRDYTDTLNQRIDLLQKNGILGAGLVLLLLGMFLRIRLAFWVALGIPISFLGMFIFASFFGLTINVLSLFGMILVIGILVDDGVVVGENIFQHFEKGKTPVRAAIDGTMEVMPSILAAIATTSLAFAFFFFIEGQLGEYFSDVSFVVIASLAISLIEVIFFLPAHLANSKALKQSYKPNKIKERVANLMFRFRDWFYKPILRFVLKNQLFYVLIVGSVFVITIAAIGGGYIQTAFFPNIEQNQVIVTLELPPGTNDRVTQETLQQITRAADSLNQRYTKERSADGDIIQKVEQVLGPGSNKGNVNLYLMKAEKREIGSFDIAADLREITGPIPNARKLSFETESPFGKPVSISLSGPDFLELREAKNALRERLEKMETLKDVVDNDREDQPEVHIALKEKGRLLGLDLEGVIFQVRSGFFGLEAQRLQRGEDEVKVWVRYDIADRRNLSELNRMRIRTQSGETIPLSEVADIQEQQGLIAINHLDGDREIKVEADLASLDVSAPDQVSRIRDEVLPPLLARYPNIDATFEGQVRQTRKLSGSAQQVGPVILILMIAFLVITFRSFSQAFALIILVPFGLVGAIWGHFIHDLPISVLSVLGFVALIGVLLNDGLVFINTFNDSLREGKSFQKSLFETGLSRFRPLVLTTVTTSAGLAPLIFEQSLQAQFLIPMAVTIAYGLFGGSFLLATLLPIFLQFANQLKVYREWLWEGKKPQPESVERAVKETKKKEKFAY